MNRILVKVNTAFNSNLLFRSITTSPLYTRYISGALWSFLGTLISQSLTLLASILVARKLGANVYGELGIIQSTLSVFALFAGSSLGLTATKYVAELEKDDEPRASKLIALTFATAIFAGICVTIILMVGAPYLSKFVLNAPQLAGPLRTSAIIIILNSLNGAQNGTLAGFQAFRRIAYSNFGRGISSFPAMLICVWLWGLPGAIVALVISAGVGCIISHAQLKKELLKRGLSITYQGAWSEWRVIFNFTLPSILSGIIVVPVTWLANVLLVNQNNGYFEMGIFNATSQWRTALAFLPAVLTQPSLPMLSSLGRNEYKDYRRLLLFTLGIVFASVLFPAILLSIFAGDIMRLYGFQNDTSSLILILLSFTAVFSAIASVFGSVIYSLGKIWESLLINCFWAIIFLGIFITLKHGALELAFAYLVSYFVHMLVVSTFSIIEIGKRWPDRNQASHQGTAQ